MNLSFSCHPWLEVLALHRKALALLDRGSYCSTLMLEQDPRSSSSKPPTRPGVRGTKPEMTRVSSPINILTLAVCALLAACSSGPDEIMPPICTTSPCTQAPVKATSRPYQINGIWYYPQAHYEYDEVGMASYYGGERKGRYQFQGRRTASGAVFDLNGITAAHKTLPLPCIVEVCNLESGRQMVVTVNDRGPYVEGRIIDVSQRVAQLLGFDRQGTAKVRVRTLVPETLALNGITSPTVMLAQTTPPPAPTPFPEPIPTLPLTTVTAVIASEATPPVVAPTPPPPVLVAAAEPLPTQPATPANTGIFIDVGRHKTHAEAIKLAQQLPEIGSFQRKPVKHTGPAPYALRVGPLASLSAADQLLDKLTAAGRISRIIIQR